MDIFRGYKDSAFNVSTFDQNRDQYGMSDMIDIGYVRKIRHMWVGKLNFSQKADKLSIQHNYILPFKQ